MACEILSFNNEAKSALAEYLNTHINHGDLAKTEEQMLYFLSPSFKADFGDYEAAVTTGYAGEFSEMKKRVNDVGEPLLQYNKTAQKHYFLDKNNHPVYFPLINKGLRGFLANDQIKSIASMMALKYFKNSKLDFNNIDFDKGTKLPNMSEFIKAEVERKERELLAVGDRTSRTKSVYVSKIKDNLKELEEETMLFFKEIGITFKQDETGEDALNPEETTKDPGFGLMSAERNSKDAVSTNIKLKLSLLPDNNNQDQLWEEPKFLKFGNVYNTLIAILTDNIALPNEDLWQLYKDSIDRMSESKPFLKDISALIGNKKSFTKEDIAEFIQAFRMVKNNHMQSDMKSSSEGVFDEYTGQQELDASGKPKTVKIMDEHGNPIIQHNTYSISDAGAKTEIVKEGWYDQFKTKFLTNTGMPTVEGSTKITDLKKYIVDTKTLLSTDVNRAKTRTQNCLKALGLTLTDEAFNNYLTNYNKNITEESQNAQLEKLINKTHSQLVNIENEFKEGKFFELNRLFAVTEFQDLAKSEAFFIEDGSDASVSQAGKRLYIYSKPSYLSNKVRQWKKDITVSLETLEADPNMTSVVTMMDSMMNNSAYNRGSHSLLYLTGRVDEKGVLTHYEKDNREDELKRLKLASERIENFDIGLFNQVSLDTDYAATTDLAMSDYIKDDVQKVLTNTFSRTITQADKGSEFNIKTGIKFLGMTFKRDSFEQQTSAATTRIFFNYLASEYNRIIEAHNEVDQSKDGSDLTVHYHYNIKKGNPLARNGNAFKMNYFERLSPNVKGLTPLEKTIQDGLYDAEGKPKLDFLDRDADIDPDLRDAIDRYIKEELLDNAIKIKESLIRNGVLQHTDKGLKITNIDSVLTSTYEKAYDQYSENAAAEAFAMDYYVNSTSRLIEYSKMFTGDVAYYKDAVDFKKRVPATYTDGLQLYTQEGQENFRVAATTSIQRASPFLEELKKTYEQDGYTFGLEEVADSYEDINSADAQAWITPDRWRFLLQGLGKWTTGKDSYESVFEKMNSRTPIEYSEKELKLAAQPLKGVYFGRQANGKPVFLKYSQAVLSHQFIQGSDLERVYQQMIDPKNAIDELITLDGIKVGSLTPTTIHDKDGNVKPDEEMSFNVMTLSNAEWKLQQDLPTKTFKDLDVGSQIQKNVFAGLLHLRADENFVLDGKFVSGQHVMDEIVKTVTGMTSKGLQRLKKEFKVDDDYQIGDVRGFYETLISDLEARGGSRNVIDALKAGIALPGIPQASSKLVSIFTSIVNDRLIKIKTNGGSFIQMSNFGLNYEKGTEQGVKWAPYAGQTTSEPTLTLDENGRVIVKPGGVLISGSFIAKYIPDWKTKRPEELFGEYDGDTLIKRGLIDPEILNNIIGYRIPNQGLASNDALRIVGILPEGNGDTIVAYTGITTKTGSDFDIDKMYMMFPTMSKRYNKTDEIYNYVNKTLEGDNKAETVKNYLDFLNEFSGNPDAEVDVEAIKDQFDSLENDDAKVAFFNSVKKVVTDIIIDPANKEHDLVKDVFSKLDIKVKALDYKKNDDGNRLIELYKSVLTHPKTYKKIMTSIDIDYFKDEINLIKPEEKSTEVLSTFNPIKDIELRYSFLGGKLGVAMEANALVDISRPGTLSLNKFHIGWGNQNAELETSFDHEYSEPLSDTDLDYYVEEIAKAKGAKFNKEEFRKAIRQVSIGDSMTAILNAFVDIAKDPYISKGNWSTATTNMGNLMLRAGMHPIMVVNFMAQPIIGEYVLFKQNLEGLGETSTTDAMFAFKRDKVFTALRTYGPEYEVAYKYNPKIINYSNDLVNAEKEFKSKNMDQDEYTAKVAEIETLQRGIKNDLAKRLKKENKDLTKDELKARINDVFKVIVEEHNKVFRAEGNVKQSLQYYREQNLGEPDMGFQFEVLSKFEELNTLSKTLRENVGVSKLDTDGAGKNINSLYKIFNMHANILSKEKDAKSLKGFNTKFNNTTLEAYYNSLQDITKIVASNPLLFPQGSSVAQGMFNEISQDVYREAAVNENLTDELEHSYNSFLMAGFFNMSEKKFETVTQKLPKELRKFIKENKDKYFMFKDLIVKNPVAGEEFSKIHLNNRKKDQFYEKSFTDSWNDLFMDHPKMAEMLVQYAYATTAFRMTGSQFFTYIPYQYMLGKDINKYVQDFTNSTQSDFIDLFYRNNLDNTKFVREIHTDMAPERVKGFGSTDDVFKISGMTNAKYYIKREGKPFRLQGYSKVGSDGRYYDPIYVKVKSATRMLNGKVIQSYNQFSIDDMYDVSDSILNQVNTQIIGTRAGNSVASTQVVNPLVIEAKKEAVTQEVEKEIVEVKSEDIDPIDTEKVLDTTENIPAIPVEPIVIIEVDPVDSRINEAVRNYAFANVNEEDTGNPNLDCK